MLTQSTTATGNNALHAERGPAEERARGTRSARGCEGRGAGLTGGSGLVGGAVSARGLAGRGPVRTPLHAVLPWARGGCSTAVPHGAASGPGLHRVPHVGLAPL